MRKSRLLSELPEHRTRRIPTGDPAFDELSFGGLPVGADVLVWGPPGSGKSRILLRWLAHARGLLIHTEEPEELIREKAPGLGVDPGRVHLLAEVPSSDELAAELYATSAELLVVDSVSRAQRPAECWRVLREVARRCQVVAIGIVHENSHHEPRGSAGPAHDVAATIRVAPARKGWARVTIRKSRYFPTGSCGLPLSVQTARSLGRPPLRAV